MKYTLQCLLYRNTQPPTSYHGENTGDISAHQDGHYDAIKVNRCPSIYNGVCICVCSARENVTHDFPPTTNLCRVHYRKDR